MSKYAPGDLVIFKPVYELSEPFSDKIIKELERIGSNPMTVKNNFNGYYTFEETTLCATEHALTDYYTIKEPTEEEMLALL